MSSHVRVLVMDVDGVLSDGGIYHGTGGVELKRFHVRDGMGVTLAIRAGILPVVITVRESEAVRRRAEDLKIAEVHQGILRKWDCLSEVLDRRGFTPEETAYVGDDVVDVPVMRRVGFPIAVGDAVEEVKREAKWVTAEGGGRGAVREAVEMILKHEGRWDEIVNDLISELS